MQFEFTHEDLQPIGRAVAAYLRKGGAKVVPEQTVSSGAPFRTTLLGSVSEKHVLVEAQGTLHYDGALKNLALWLGANRLYSEFYIAIDSEATVGVGVLGEMKREGVGLMVVDEDKQVSIEQGARNPALVVTPDPTLRFGDRKAAVGAAVKKFNNVDRKDGLRDMCELVEGETTRVTVAVARKGLFNAGLSIKVIEDDKSWEDRINLLASKQAYDPQRTPVLSPNLRADLVSFKTARNLVDHPARGKRESVARERQFAERMAQGPRLVAELVSLHRRVRRMKV